MTTIGIGRICGIGPIVSLRPPNKWCCRPITTLIIFNLKPPISVDTSPPPAYIQCCTPSVQGCNRGCGRPMQFIVQRQEYEETKLEVTQDSSAMSHVCLDNDSSMDEIDSWVEALDNTDYLGGLQGKPFPPMCHLGLPLNTIHNNDEIHYYTIVHAFDLYLFSIGDLTCHTFTCL